ncbi:MAG: type II toxin-antitoxin system RelE/ParE family toxin [Chloroflexota bacterium]
MYKLELSPAALREARRLPPLLKGRVDEAMARLAENPRPPGTVKLRGVDGYRLRVGDYRVLYVIDDAAQHVLVYRVMARSEVYRVR